MSKSPHHSFNFADLFGFVAQAVPDRPVIVCGEDSITYRELDERSSALAGYLHEHGIRRGDNVGLQLFNGPAYLEGFLAACKIGAVPFNINYRYVKSELEYIYTNSDVAALFFNGALADDVLPVAAGIDTLKLMLVAGETPPSDDSRLCNLEDAIAAGLEEPDPSERSGEDLLIIYTGGTTGAPKGVMWPHQALFFGALGGGAFFHPGGPVQAPAEVGERVADTPWLRTLPLAPLMHGAALWSAVSSLLAGHTIVLNPDTAFDAERIWDMVTQKGVNIMAIVGDAMAAPLVEALEANPDRWNLAALAHTLAKALMVRLGTPVFSDAHLEVFGTPSSSPST